MRFFLARHAQAEFGEQLDPIRGLTDTGKAQVKVMAEFLATQTDKIGAVLCSSDLRRGRQTGEKLAKRLDVDVLYTPFVDPPNNEGTVSPADVRKLWSVINVSAKGLEDGEQLLIVSHGPLVNAFCAWLLNSGEGDKFHFSHGSVTRWDTEDPTPASGYPYEGRGEKVKAYLHWMVTPKLMNRALEQDAGVIVEAAVSLADALLAELGFPIQVDEKGGEYYMEDVLKKRVTEGDSQSGPCDDCDGNIEAGWIDSEDVYPSGHDGPEFHPKCVCVEEYKASSKRVYV